MVLAQLRRVRWAVRATLILGVAASVVANVLHALDNPISQTIAAWPPLALLLTVELISRVPVHRRLLAAARLLSTAIIAGIAAWVSYWHMAGVASKYGEVGASPYLLPLSVDGLIVVASICLVELGGRISAMEADRTALAAAAGSAVSAAHPGPAVARQPNPDPGPRDAVLAPDSAGSAQPDPDSVTPAEDTKSPDVVRPGDPDAATARPDPTSENRPNPDRRASGRPAGAGPAGPPRRPAGRPAPVGAGTGPRASGPAASHAPAAARATQNALAYQLDEQPAAPQPSHALSLREQVYQLLDAEPPGEAQKPPQIADALLPRLPGGDRETVSRYVRLWRKDVAEGRRSTAGRLRAVPVPARS